MIGADALSQYVDWTDRGTCIIFGDAAGAVLVQVMVFILVFDCYSICKQLQFLSLLASKDYYLIVSEFWSKFNFHLQNLNCNFLPGNF